MAKFITLSLYRGFLWIYEGLKDTYNIQTYVKHLKYFNLVNIGNYALAVYIKVFTRINTMGLDNWSIYGAREIYLKIDRIIKIKPRSCIS